MRRKVNKFIPNEKDYEQVRQAILMHSVSRISYVILWLFLLLISIHSMVVLGRVETIDIVGVVIGLGALLFELICGYRVLLMDPKKFNYSEGKILYKWKEDGKNFFNREEHFYADIKFKDGRIEKGLSISDELFNSDIVFVAIAKNKKIQHVFIRNTE